MTQVTIQPRESGRTHWRAAGWGLAFALLLMPAVAMQFTSEVYWTSSDFVAAAVILLVVGIGMELVVGLVRSRSSRLLAIAAIIGALGWLWAELAVGVFTTWGS